jgi:tetratricopeptide (TPR) repeat protein
MALRLTGPSLVLDGPPDPAALSAQASVALAAGDLIAYRRLFAQAGEHTDVHRRHRARCALLEAALKSTAGASPRRASQIFIAIAGHAIALLEEEPREPVLLNYAGVALYELWSLDAAQALFAAALRLDPSLPHVRGNLDQVASRRCVVRGRRSEALAAVHPLAARANAVAARAQPASGLTLSLCMIVRDEEEMLPRCLAAAAPAVDELIVVDTGSTDRTVEIARSFGARVIEHAWTGSFSDARNVSFDAATGDWIMYLDADEVLVGEDADKLRAVTGRTWREAFYLVETNFTGDLEEGTAVTHNAMRIFRNRPEYRFTGRLHEQIGQTLPGYLPERLEQTSIRVEHYGYLGAVRDAKEKSRRNIELLLAQQAESADTPFLHFNLGSEYAAAGDAHAALAEFQRAWAMVEADPHGEAYEFTPSLISRLVKSLRVCGRNEDAIERARDGLARFPGFTDLVFEQATAAIALGREAEAIANYERCLDLGDAPARYTATRGCGTFLPRIALAELHLHHGELEPARELLDWCLTHHPAFFGTILPYASARLRGGAPADEVSEEIEARVATLTPTIRFMLGTALYEAGAAAAAERQYQLVLERQPHSAQARVALAEVLLYMRRYEEAAGTAAQLPAESPLGAIAARSELFARIAGGDHSGLVAARERARAAGLDPAELNLFDGWAALAAGRAPAAPVALAAVPLLATILEALLRVEEFTIFETLVPLLRDSDLVTREQRELLAGIYHRRGFLASAAAEWMAVCSEQPDARALLGLARVAARQGMHEDVAVFAAEALGLAPGSAEAKSLLARARSGGARGADLAAARLGAPAQVASITVR